MCRYAFIEVLVLLLMSGIGTSDRLDNVQQQPVSYSTLSQGGGQSFQHQSNAGDYKNLYKGTPSIYAASSNPTLLHKTYYSTPRVPSSNTELHRDIIPIVKQTFEPNKGDGSYSFSYETGNGITASEYGAYKAGATSEEGIQSASGSYSYTGPDNIIYTITYTAGVEGFVPQGAHLPTPPPSPEALQKVLPYAEPNTYQTESSKYQPYAATNEAFTARGKYPSNESGSGTSSNKYTAAVQIPYTGYNRNTNYGKLPSSYSNEYRVHDEFSK